METFINTFCHKLCMRHVKSPLVDSMITGPRAHTRLPWVQTTRMPQTKTGRTRIRWSALKDSGVDGEPREVTNQRQLSKSNLRHGILTGFVSISIAAFTIFYLELPTSTAQPTPPPSEAAGATAPPAPEEVKVKVEPITACGINERGITSTFTAGVANSSYMQVRSALNRLQDELDAIKRRNVTSELKTASQTKLGASVRACLTEIPELEIILAERLGRPVTDIDFSLPDSFSALNEIIVKARRILDKIEEMTNEREKHISILATPQKTIGIIIHEMGADLKIRGEIAEKLRERENPITLERTYGSLTEGEQGEFRTLVAQSMRPRNPLGELFAEREGITNPDRLSGEIVAEAVSKLDKIEKAPPQGNGNTIAIVFAAVSALVMAFLAYISRMPKSDPSALHRPPAPDPQRDSETDGRDSIGRGQRRPRNDESQFLQNVLNVGSIDDWPHKDQALALLHEVFDDTNEEERYAIIRMAQMLGYGRPLYPYLKDEATYNESGEAMLKRAKHFVRLPDEAQARIWQIITEDARTLLEWARNKGIDRTFRYDKDGYVSAITWDTLKYKAHVDGAVRIGNPQPGKPVYTRIDELEIREKDVDGLGEGDLKYILNQCYFDADPTANTPEGKLRRMLAIQRMKNWFENEQPGRGNAGSTI